MAKTTRAKRKASRSNSRGRTRTRTSSTVRSATTSRARSIPATATSGSRSSSRGRVSRNIYSVASSRSERNALVRGRVKKSVSFKKKPIIKVTSKFKAQVKKALQPGKAVGHFTEIDGTGQAILSVVNGGKQEVFNIAPNGGAGNNWAIFSPVDVLDAASCLFNDKPATQTKATASGSITVPGAGSFDIRNVKIEVLKSSFQAAFKNNSLRTLMLTLYECSPKKLSNSVTDSTAEEIWRQAMLNEANSAFLLPNSKAINIAGTEPSTLYATPYMSKTFKAAFNIEQHDIVLDPGQTFEHYMEGPTGVYDFAKFWKPDGTTSADVFYNMVPSKTRYLFCVMKTDLCNTDLGASGRYGVPGTQQRLLWEYQKKFTILAPEQAGGTAFDLAVPVVGGQINFNNTQLRDCYLHKNYGVVTGNPQFRVDVATAADNAP